MITYSELNDFRLEYHADPAYRNQRFGQAFCNKYNITDNELYYEKNEKKAERIIITDNELYYEKNEKKAERIIINKYVYEQEAGQ